MLVYPWKKNLYINLIRINVSSSEFRLKHLRFSIIFHHDMQILTAHSETMLQHRHLQLEIFLCFFNKRPKYKHIQPHWVRLQQYNKI